MPTSPRQTTNRRSLQRTIRELGDAGHLQAVDEALVTLTVSLADAVDDDPGNASLWREYRAALATLLEVGLANDSADRSFADEMSAPLRNAKKS